MSLELLSKLSFGHSMQQECAIFCQTKDNVKLGKQTAYCLTPNHSAEKSSYLLSFMWVMVSGTLRYIWLSSYCAGNYTDNIKTCLQKQSMLFLLWDRNTLLWLCFCTLARPLEAHKTLFLFFHGTYYWNKKRILEFVTAEPKVQESGGKPARHLLQHQAFNCGA